VGAVEFSAEVRGSFFSMGEAGDDSGCEGTVLYHGQGKLIL